jgi:pimeloyl-ACP methyl ester carboxylesterase
MRGAVVSEDVSSGAFDGDLRTWERQLSPIGASYRAIAYSRRYARPNQDIKPSADDQMLPHVDGLVAFLRLLAAAPCADTSHLMHEENAAAVNRAILDFLSRTTAARRPVVR